MKKISLRKVSNMLSDKQLKQIIGGYDPSTRQFSLKCNGSSESCKVYQCPDDKKTAQNLCSSSLCGGTYGDSISCG